MILLPASRPNAGRVTLDQLLQGHAKRTPDKTAIADPPDRLLWADGPPRQLSWADVDAATGAISSRLIDLGMPVDGVVLIQGPNNVDTILAILGCLRANLIPAMLPQGWRNAEAGAAAERLGAKAIFAATRAGPARPADALRYVAAEHFSIRFVCAFGPEPPDGVVSFEDCILDAPSAGALRSPRLGNPAEHIAVVTFDCGPSGYFPVPRSHNEWLAAGLSVVSETRLGRDDVLLATLSPATFAGLATGVLPWLMSGAELVLHQAFDRDRLVAQVEQHRATHLVMPSPALDACLADGADLGGSLRHVCRVVRRPDADPAGEEVSALPVSSLCVLGEIGLLPVDSGISGELRLPLGAVSAPPGVDDAPAVVETGITTAGRLALRGPMVPRAAFPGSDRAPPYPTEADGWVSAGFPAGLEDGRIVVTGPRDDVISVGGHALSIASVEAAYADTAGAMAVSARALPDPVLGQRVGLEAVPEAGAQISAVSFAVHGESKGLSPLALTADVQIGDRRRSSRLAGAA